ncbi:hypothetical protein CspeluHIS016_0603600 [Cutaneotrichosporon spelunceum]|uniref:PLP-dependent transferase n=1 Tax=Cutaneotrichosporon spelunceum TaxID=1672016 RepID=A0AAD3TXV9_9TREE|nr:hypothetical protein CspeluHIS016_0603600 [Cutaneotrichosporon spelunceum]
MQLPNDGDLTSEPVLTIQIEMPSSDPGQTYQLFAYGTLAVPAIVARVLGRKIDDLSFQHAILQGYTRHHVCGKDYPAIIDEKRLCTLLGKDIGQLSDDERSTRGTVIAGLTHKDMLLLDVFEGHEYTRITTKVTTYGDPCSKDEVSLKRDQSAPGSTVANVYIWSAPVTLLEPKIWSFDEFVRDKAEAWATLNNHEFAAVEASRVFAVDEYGLVGKSVKGFPDFGHSMKKHWGFDPNYVNLNHGSYGSPPLVVFDAKEKLGRRMETAVDRYMRRKLEPTIEDIRKQVAPMINATAEEVVLVPNATHGVNTISVNIDWKDGDVIVVYATTYNAVSQTMKCVCDRNPGVKLEIILVDLPCYHSEIVEKTEAVFAKYNKPTGNTRGGSEPAVATGVSAKERVRLVVVDSISSMPGVVYPWQQVTQLCHQYGVLSLVDAAHSIGQHHVDMKEADPDFFISNCHKWLMTFRGGALMFVARRNQRLIRSSFPTGHYYESERYPTVDVTHPWAFAPQFSWNGTADFTSYLTIPDTLKFRESIGGEDRIIAYNHSLAVAGGKRLAKRWGTRFMDNDKGELTACMANVELPDFPKPADGNERAKIHRFIEDALLFDYNAFAAPMYYNNTWWARFSAQVWVELEDFDYLAECFEKIRMRLKAGERVVPFDTNFE